MSAIHHDTVYHADIDLFEFFGWEGLENVIELTAKNAAEDFIHHLWGENFLKESKASFFINFRNISEWNPCFVHLFDQIFTVNYPRIQSLESAEKLWDILRN